MRIGGRGSFMVRKVTIPAALDERITLGLREVLGHHLAHQRVEPDAWLPPQTLACLAGVAEQAVDLGCSKIARVDFDDTFSGSAIVGLLVYAGSAPLQVHVEIARRQLDEL